MAHNSLESSKLRREGLERELSELLDVKSMVEGQLFQKYFASPLHAQDKELKKAYDCKNMDELRYNHGLHEGITRIFQIMDEVETKARFIRNDLNKL